MARGVSRYYTVQPREEAAERQEQSQAYLQRQLGDFQGSLEGLTVSQQVAIARALYNNTYYSNLPSHSAMSDRDTVPYTMAQGAFARTNEESRRPDYRVSMTADVISELYVSYLQKALRSAIQNEMYRDRKLMGYLPRGVASANITVDTRYEATNNTIEVIIHGPFWLRFFFTGRRAFTISGNSANERSHGMLVFLDPATGDKIVTKTVHMPAIPKGLYVEKAVRSVLNNLLDSERFDKAFNKVFHPNQKSSAFYGISYEIGNWETFQAILVSQIRTIRGTDDIAAYDLLKEIGRGRVVNVRKIQDLRQYFIAAGSQAREAFDRAVQEYSRAEDQESRKEKIKVYAALRELLANTKTTLSLRDAKAILPANLAGRSTAGGIYRSTVPKL